MLKNVTHFGAFQKAIDLYQIYKKGRPAMQKQATFTAMTEGTPADYAIIRKANGEHAKALADRILDHLALLKGDNGGFAIDRYRHCLQTATRAYRDGSCLLYTSPSPRDRTRSRMPSSA